MRVGMLEVFSREPTGEFTLHAYIEGATLSDARTNAEERIWKFVVRLRHLAIDHKKRALSGD